MSKDPTRTTGLRRKFMADINRRVRKLKKDIVNLIMTEDAFGIVPQKKLKLNAEAQRWVFQTDAGKVKSFQAWLQAEVDSGVLTQIGTGYPWTNPYIESSYKKGMVRAYTDVHHAELAKSTDFFDGTKEQFLTQAFAAPESISKLQLLYTRSFAQLKGYTDAMSQTTTRVLAEALAGGHGAAKTARALTESIDGLTRTRGMTIARTEMIYAHAEGQLDGFVVLGVDKIHLQVEWSTAGDNRVCARCAEREGDLFTVEEARGWIPLHPNCRCAWIPGPDPALKK